MEIVAQPLLEEDGLRVGELVAFLARRPRRHVEIFVVDGKPQAWQRARRAKNGGFYTAKETRFAEDYVGLLWRSALRGRVLQGPVAVAALFYLPTHRWTDTDNLFKLILDAGNKAQVWRDDSQTTAQASIVEYDRHRPRTVVGFCEATSSLIR